MRVRGARWLILQRTSSPSSFGLTADGVYLFVVGAITTPELVIDCSGLCGSVFNAKKIHSSRENRCGDGGIGSHTKGFIVSSVSAIIPLYNKAATVARTLSSILAQKREDLEVVVVDDGSTDNSVEEVLKIADKRIRLVRQKNAGPGAARNAGASQAESPLLAFL